MLADSKILIDGVKISELTPLSQVDGEEFIPIQRRTENFKMSIGKIVTKGDLETFDGGMVKVQDTSDVTEYGDVFNV